MSEKKKPVMSIRDFFRQALFGAEAPGLGGQFDPAFANELFPVRPPTNAAAGLHERAGGRYPVSPLAEGVATIGDFLSALRSERERRLRMQQFILRQQALNQSAQLPVAPPMPVHTTGALNLPR